MNQLGLFWRSFTVNSDKQTSEKDFFFFFFNDKEKEQEFISRVSSIQKILREILQEDENKLHERELQEK